ncbi:DNA methyltransferase [Okeania sp. SIO2B3]|uniref:DNA methyltransferase n=1 Tax=Okeania sp. SIO2B3 TaxID=2607784 RepID=UPI0013BF29C9|nr:DNA methyltransferase [Okeania sp. SIO2B3]NET43978.1 hypothetical protein [Okeania sp. SIO2B3]
MNIDLNPNWKKLTEIDWNFSQAQTNYLTHRLHPYPAKFIPQIPHQLIQELSQPGEIVADIFCGSGTTLVEALTQKRHTIGIDANPIACLISEAKTTCFNTEDKALLNSLVKRTENLSQSIYINTKSPLLNTEKFTSYAARPNHKAISFWFEPFVVEELAEILNWCQQLSTKSSRKIALTAFSSIVVTVSKQDSDTRYVRRQKKIFPGDTCKRFTKALKEAIVSVSEFTNQVEANLNCQVNCANLLTKPDIGDVDLVVCSPPYPNAYSYHLYHMTRMIWLGMNQPKFKQEEIGSHRKYSSKSSKGATIETFRSEMETIFEWLGEHLKFNRYACFVVGDSLIKGKKISNVDLISEVAKDYGFSEIKRIHRQMQDRKKYFNPAIGRIKTEQILILQNSGKPLLKCKIKPYIQPFERKLALSELTTLTGSEPYALTTEKEVLNFQVFSNLPANILASKLSYWESVTQEDKTYITTQVKREATVNTTHQELAEISKNVPFYQSILFPKRRCLRYGTHGIHEYRGKFFPQLVRSLINIAKVPEKAIIADPMSGSGTTLVEAVLGSYHGVGLDMNPLSVLIGKTKCDLLSVPPDKLLENYQQVADTIGNLKLTKFSAKLHYFSTLPRENQVYLNRWFAKDVLAELDKIMILIKSVENNTMQNFMQLSLSNIIRKVSWQKESDLRVRKEIINTANIQPKQEFLNELENSVKTVLSFLYQNQDSQLGTFDIQGGDARKLTTTWQDLIGKVDVVITSPPYATALPYLDTDRLSLCYLNLLSRSQHRKQDLKMIGNREITGKQRRDYWEYFQQKKALLPQSVISLIEKIDRLNTESNAGFRRRNLAALLAKYFFDMREVFQEILQLLKPGAFAYIVIGNNHTIAGGERVKIETAKLLVDIGEMVGLEIVEQIEMEMLASRNIFKKNAIASELILSFKRLI